MRRSCQRQTLVLALPVRRMISFVPSPSALKSTIGELGAALEAMRKQTGLSGSAQTPKPAEAAPEAPKPAGVTPQIPPITVPEFVSGIPAGAGNKSSGAPPPPPPKPALAANGHAAHKAAKSLEENLTSRWLVWLGAVAIALSGTFLVKYAIDNGFLGPVARVSLGFVFGVALAIAGEWLRQRAIAAIRVNYVPPALTASGVFIAFASVYAAYALYGLLPPLVAFAGLALVALLAIGLSLLQGPFVALMGILGAFVAPALVVSPNPSACGLFPYLLVVEAAYLTVARYRAWWKFALATLAGAIVWPVLWMASRNWSAVDALPLGVYLLLSAMIFFALRWRLEEPPQERSLFDDVFRFDIPEGVIWIAATAIAVVQFLMVVVADFSVTSLTFAWLSAALYFCAGRKKADLDGLLLFAAILGLAVAATMTLPGTVVRPSPLPGSPYVPPELLRYTGMSVAFGVLFGVGGFVGLWGARRPAIWAGVSACVPFLLLAIAYYRIVDFGIDYSWALMALALAAVNVFAAERVERYRAAHGLEITLGFYAAAVVACISLAAAMTIRQAWLTVALSMQLPALAWIDARIRARSVQVIAAIVATGALVRLVLNYNVLSYPVADNLAASWVIYGYGIPAVSFLWSAKLFRKTNVAALVKLLEGGGLTFCVLLVSLQLRLFIAGSLDAPYYGLLELESAVDILAVHRNRAGRLSSPYESRRFALRLDALAGAGVRAGAVRSAFALQSDSDRRFRGALSGLQCVVADLCGSGRLRVRLRMGDRKDAVRGARPFRRDCRVRSRLCLFVAGGHARVSRFALVAACAERRGDLCLFGGLARLCGGIARHRHYVRPVAVALCLLGDSGGDDVEGFSVRHVGTYGALSFASFLGLGLSLVGI